MKKILAALALVATLWASPAWAVYNYELKIDTIDGESVRDKFAGWIDITSWSWGLSNTGSSSGGGGGGAGKAVFQDFSWTQGLDKSAIPIFLGVASGKHFKDAKLDVLKPGKAPDLFFEMIFANTMLTSFHLNGDGASQTATAALNYDKVTLRYRPQKADGSFDAWIEGTFDLKGNVVTFAGNPGVVLGLLQSGGQVTLDALPPAAPVPEPQTWALLLAGLIASGGWARRRGMHA